MPQDESYFIITCRHDGYQSRIIKGNTTNGDVILAKTDSVYMPFPSFIINSDVYFGISLENHFIYGNTSDLSVIVSGTI